MLKINYRETGELIPYVNNSRTHSEQQVQQVASSIKEFGFTNPILIDEQDGIIAGHGRLLAAQKLKLDEVPTITLEGLTDAQRKAYVIADNQLALNADWDIDALKVEVDRLTELDFNIDLLGFDDDFLSSLLEEEPAEGLTDEDSVPELEDDPVTVEGDVWILGNHRLMCGNSDSQISIDKLMNGNKATGIVTDPPYGIGIDGQRESKSKNPKHNRKAHEFKGWDSQRPSESIFNFIVSLRIPTVIWGGNYFADLLPATRGWIYWSKGQDGLTMSDGELAWTTENKPLRSKTVNRASLRGSVHPTQKPVDIILHSLEYIKMPELSICLDLFGGSGSTLIACQKTNRYCYMMELDPKYCDVIIKRWQDFTGQEAIIESTGDKFNDMYINGRKADFADSNLGELKAVK